MCSCSQISARLCQKEIIDSRSNNDGQEMKSETRFTIEPGNTECCIERMFSIGTVCSVNTPCAGDRRDFFLHRKQNIESKLLRRGHIDLETRVCLAFVLFIPFHYWVLFVINTCPKCKCNSWLEREHSKLKTTTKKERKKKSQNQKTKDIETDDETINSHLTILANEAALRGTTATCSIWIWIVYWCRSHSTSSNRRLTLRSKRASARALVSATLKLRFNQRVRIVFKGNENQIQMNRSLVERTGGSADLGLRSVFLFCFCETRV